MSKTLWVRLVPVSAFGASSDPEDIKGHVRLSVEHVPLNLSTLPEA